MDYFTDTHTHLSDEAFGGEKEQDEAVARAVAAGVTRLVIPDVSSKERKAMMDLCRRNPGHCFPCLGLHPTEIEDNWKDELMMLESELARCHETGAESRTPRIVAIGESGLDYHYGAETATWQKEAFRMQIELALQYKLPLIVHCREAMGDILNILAEYKSRGLRGVFHAYSGSLESFRELSRLGDWHVGIGGVLTFKKAAIAGFIKDIPLDRILLETDSPYLSPVPFRGKRNESANIPVIAKFLSECTAWSLGEIAEETNRNADRVFGL